MPFVCRVLNIQDVGKPRGILCIETERSTLSPFFQPQWQQSTAWPPPSAVRRAEPWAPGPAAYETRPDTTDETSVLSRHSQCLDFTTEMRRKSQWDVCRAIGPKCGSTLQIREIPAAGPHLLLIPIQANWAKLLQVSPFCNENWDRIFHYGLHKSWRIRPLIILFHISVLPSHLLLVLILSFLPLARGHLNMLAPNTLFPLIFT